MPHRLYPARLLCPWNFPGKNIGVGCYFLPHGNFLTQAGIKPTFPVLQANYLPSEPSVVVVVVVVIVIVVVVVRLVVVVVIVIVIVVVVIVVVVVVV